jgi:hypothetical protein
MANIALKTADRVEVVGFPIQQLTLPAAEAITAGMPVRIDTAGKFTPSNGTTTGEARVWGIGTKTVAAGEALTAVRRGILDGFTFSQAYDAAIYLSDTDGTLADAAGTVSTVVGRVVPGWSQLLGSNPDKLLSVEL